MAVSTIGLLRGYLEDRSEMIDQEEKAERKGSAILVPSTASNPSLEESAPLKTLSPIFAGCSLGPGRLL